MSEFAAEPPCPAGCVDHQIGVDPGAVDAEAGDAAAVGEYLLGMAGPQGDAGFAAGGGAQDLFEGAASGSEPDQSVDGVDGLGAGCL